MNIKSIFGSVVLFGLLSANLAHGQPNFFFYESFDEGLGTSPVSGTKWTWQAPYSITNSSGMMVGQGDIYEVSDQVVVKGGSSLRLNFDGRNGWCNTCGANSYTVASTADSESFLVTEEDGALYQQPSQGRPVFNKTDRWARWVPSAVSGQQLLFQDSSPSRNSMFGDGMFDAGDEVLVANQCGVDGTIGGELGRRNDCNLAINYLQGVSSNDFDYGKTLARRFYIHVPPQTVLPDRTLKLGYTWFENSSNGRYHVYPLVSVQRNEKIEVATRSIVGSQSFTGIQLERGTWYYLEELYKRETEENASDGVYELYFYKHDEVTNAPTLRLTNITFGSLLNMSIIGNWQHGNDATGYLFIDEVAVADGYIGPVEGGLQILSPPRAPAVTID